MTWSKYRIIAIILFFLTLVISYYLYTQLPCFEKNTINFYTIFGTSISLYGIVLTYVQILSINKVNKETNNKINNALNKFNQIFNISDLSKALKITSEIQKYLRDDKFEIALLRMQDLKYILIQIQHVEVLKEITKEDYYKRLIPTLGDDIISIDNHLK